MTARQASLPAQNAGAADGGEDRLGRLFAGLFPGPVEGALDNAALRGKLVDCADRQSVVRLIDETPLDSRQRGLLTLGQRVLNDFFTQTTFHPSLSASLLDEMGPMLAPLTRDDGWLNGHRHPFYRLLEQTAELALGWHPEHVQAEEMAAQMQSWFRRQADMENIQPLVAEAGQWARRFRERTGKLEQRLRDREKGALRLQYANREAARVINRQLAGRELPQSLAADLQRVWLPGLQWILLNESAGEGLWNRAVRMLTLLFWSVQPATEGRAADKRRRVAKDVKRELPDLLDRILPEPGLVGRMLEELQIIWLSLDHDRPLEFVSVPPLETGSLLDQAGASVSRDLLGEIAGVSERDWFREQASGRRFRLLMKHDDYQELMFVDQAGFKAATISFEDFAWQLTNGSVMPMGVPARPAELVAESLTMLAQRFREKRRAGNRAPVAVAPAPEEAASGVAQDSAREAREAARQRREEALRQPVPEAGGHADPRRRKWARLLVSGLTLGSWLTIEKDGHHLTRKLILILSSTDKYVLVAVDGTGRMEYSRAELIDGVADGVITVSDDTGYDDTLGRVVEGIQRRKAGV